MPPPRPQIYTQRSKLSLTPFDHDVLNVISHHLISENFFTLIKSTEQLHLINSTCPTGTFCRKKKKKAGKKSFESH